MNFKQTLLTATAILIMFSAIFFTLPAKADATSIVIEPVIGTIGDRISLTGNGFIGKLATIYWDDKKIIQNIPVSKQGQISYTFEIPTTTKGVHIIKVTDDSNWSTITAFSEFTVVPGIVMEPPWGKPMNTVTIIGNGFAPGETGIKIYFEGKILSKTPITADKMGSWHYMFQVPELSKDEYKISVTGDATQPGEVPEAIFTIAPFCKAAPLSGPVGTRVTISGVGFRAGEDGITFTWDGPILDTNFVALPNGSFSYDIIVPPSTKGRHIIGIYGSSFTPKGIVPDIEFEVTPQISITPSELINSKDIRIDGTGYNAGELVSITYDNINTGKSTTTDAKGNFSIVIQPLGTVGKNHTIIATGNKGAVAQATYILSVTVPAAPQLLYPGPGAKIETYNSAINVILSMFKYIGDIFNTPSSSQHKMDDAVLFSLNWDISGDKTDLKYTVQISKTEDFSDMVLLKEGITSPPLQVTKSDLPLDSAYYWRVKAINESGLSSPWSNAWKFEIATASPLILATSILIMLLGLTVIVFAIFAIIAIINRNKAGI